MNRTTAILIALAVLLAHVFAIHQGSDGEFAPPWESAHVAYRVARNLVRSGVAVWNPGEAAVQSYPSLVWLGLCAAAERAYWPPTLVSQAVGILCALMTVVVLAGFSTTRTAGLIAVALLAASGAAAAAAASGTELGLTMLLVTFATLAFERGWRRAQAGLMALLVLVGPEGTIFVALLFAFEWIAPPRHALATSFRGGRIYGAALAAFVLSAIVRWSTTGELASPTMATLLEVDPSRWRLGLSYVTSYFLQSGSGPLLIVPLVALASGRLKGQGRRALLMALAWTGVVALLGGDGRPFWASMVPALPLFFLSIQASMETFMDERPRLEPAFWALLVLGSSASLLASRVPGDIGPIPLRGVHAEWMQPSDRMLRAFGKPLGRPGLVHELEQVERLRALGVFLRDRVDEEATVMTPWPGAIGYLSRKRVYDLLGRARPSRGDGRSRGWWGAPRVDLVEALGQQNDYVVPVIDPPETLTGAIQQVSFLLERYDVEGPSPERMLAVLAALSTYELVSVPVPDRSYTPGVPSTRPFLILRHRSLEQAPRLSIEGADGRYEILAEHDGHAQVVDLEVVAVLTDGRELQMRPTGTFVANPAVRARKNVVVHATKRRAIRLVGVEVPADLDALRLVARFRNPVSFDEEHVLEGAASIALR